jgi:ABC-type dipeptide/oligopeptide/nickel transport system permease component
MLFGARFSLSIGLTVVFFSALIGLILGSIAGYNGGLVDEIIMRIVDGFLAVPSMFLALAVVGFLGPGLANVILALVVWSGPLSPEWSGAKSCRLKARSSSKLHALWEQATCTSSSATLPEYPGPCSGCGDSWHQQCRPGSSRAELPGTGSAAGSS